MNTPTLLFIGGHDPSGGAGLQADLETALGHDCRAASLVTCLTAQDTRNVEVVYPQPVEAFSRQLDLLLADIQPDLVKIGLLGDTALAQLLGSRLATLGAPVLLDPVLAAGGGRAMADRALIEAIRGELLPLCTLVTPNRREARLLGDAAEPELAVRKLLDLGARQVLLTGADEAEGERVRNRLLGRDFSKTFDYPLLPHPYHGSGCTLAAACACRLAYGEPIETAVKHAQDWTWRCLEQGIPLGRGQWLPNRRTEIPA